MTCANWALPLWLTSDASMVVACRELQVDTVAWRDFQGPGGQARPLAALVEQQLGRSIQTGTCHSAR